MARYYLQIAVALGRFIRDIITEETIVNCRIITVPCCCQHWTFAPLQYPYQGLFATSGDFWARDYRDEFEDFEGSDKVELGWSGH